MVLGLSNRVKLHLEEIEMADNKPQEWIDAEKRKLQPQAFGSPDPFMKEMKAAEAKGDLSGRAHPMEYEALVTGSAVGGETPLQAVQTYERLEDERTASIDRNDKRYHDLMESAGFGRDFQDSRPFFDLVGRGHIRLTDGAKQREMMALYNELESTPNPSKDTWSGEADMSMADVVGTGHKEDRYAEGLERGVTNIAREFPETKKEGPIQYPEEKGSLSREP